MLTARWLTVLMIFFPTLTLAQEAFRLQERLIEGTRYTVSTRTALEGTLTLPAEKDKPSKTLAITGQSAIDYDERILQMVGREVKRTIRLYHTIDFRRSVDGKPQEATIRRPVRRLVILRHKQTEVPFSPDGPLLWSELDVVRTDVFTPALLGLLPITPVRAGDTWEADRSAAEELTDMERIDRGAIQCRMERVEQLGNRRYARLTLAGTLEGINEDGPNRQDIKGTLLFDLESNHLAYLSFQAASQMLADGKQVGEVKGTFTLTRRTDTRCEELSDDQLRGVKLEPDAESTRLLYDDPEFGVRFQYPRRWRISSVRGRQLTLDEPSGSGLLITLEPADAVPSAETFLAEVRGVLAKALVKERAVTQARRLREGNAILDRFSIEAEEPKQKVQLDYFVLKQTIGGATFAARLLPTDQAAVRADVEAIARSLTITRRIEAKK